MNPELTIMLYRGSEPSPVKMFDHPVGTYATLVKSEIGYTCKVTVVRDGKRVLEQMLSENTLGRYLLQLQNLKKQGVLLRGVFLHEDNQDGLRKAIGRLKEKVMHVIIKVQ